MKTANSGRRKQIAHDRIPVSGIVLSRRVLCLPEVQNGDEDR